MTMTTSDLTKEELAMFLEIAEASLRVTRREQFFSLLQGKFQYLLPHEVVFCGIGDTTGEVFVFESFSSTMYPDSCAKAAMSFCDGVIWRLMTSWKKSRRPVMMGRGLLPGEYDNYRVPFTEDEVNLVEVELDNIAAHGMGGANGSASTFFCFSQVPQKLGKTHARLLELFMPYLHSALIRVSGNREDIQRMLITGREREVLLWVKKGKTNEEIGEILGISKFTVKNHVQKILRKLNVQNRSHAVVKANSLLQVGKES